jgi:hypothetical protein
VTITGIGASPGVAVGPVFRLEPEELGVREAEIEACDLDHEIQAFRDALDLARHDLTAIRDGIAAELGEDAAAIYDAHLLILDDPEMIKAVESGVRDRRRNAAWVFQGVMSSVAARFDNIDDEYLRERRSDILDCERRVLRYLLGAGRRSLGELKAPAVIVAHDLGPSEVAVLPRDKVLAFVLEVGGRTSHGAIVARGRGIPAVMSVKGALHAVKPGDRRRRGRLRRLGRGEPGRGARGRVPAPARAAAAPGRLAPGHDRAPGGDAGRPPHRAGREPRAAGRRAAGDGGGRRRHRALPHRVLLPEPRRSPERGGAVRRLPRRHRDHGRASGHLPHHGPGRRQGGVVPGRDARDQPVPGTARHPPGAREPGDVPHPAPRHLPALGARERCG